MIRLLSGDCRDVLATLPAESVQCVVCSPPYYGLRDYQTGTWDGGDAGCDHQPRPREVLPPATIRNATFRNNATTYLHQGAPSRVCACGAVRVDRQIGLEATPDAYLATMVGVFREVRRVLRRDGTCWVNMGDGYVHGPPHAGSVFTNGRKDGRASNASDEARGRDGSISLLGKGLAPKQLLLMPARLALALQADGWWVRSAIVWAKPNPMPESVDSRPTSAYEMVYLLAKGEWKSRIVKFADLPSERVHLLQDFGLRPGITSQARSPAGRNYHPIVQNCIHLAAAIFDRAQRENEFGLPPFYSEVWQKGAGDCDSDLVRALPEEHRAAAFGARFLAAQTTAKEFMAELHGCQIALADRDDLLIGRAAAGSQLLSPSVYSNRERAITIHDAGKVCEIDFVHSEVILKSPSKCNYFYDADAVREAHQDHNVVNGVYTNPKAIHRDPDNVPPNQGWTTGANGFATKHRDYNPAGRNLRNVWTIATSPYSAAHFATYPPELAERCIKAGTSERGCCVACGKPWVRVTETAFVKLADRRSTRKAVQDGANMSDINSHNVMGYNDVTTTGWSPGCQCDAATVPCTVLDPFAGAGTTLLVADRLQRDAVGIELNTAYTEMAMERCRADAPLFTRFPPAEDPEETRMADLFTEMAAD